MFCERLIIFCVRSDHVIGKTHCPSISAELVTFHLYFCEVLSSSPETVFSDWGYWFSSVPFLKCGDAGRPGNWTTVTSLRVLSNSSVGKAVRLLAGRTGVRIPTGQGFSLLQNVQPDSEAHPAFYWMGPGGFHEGKAAVAGSWPVTSI
jgi:hypothetical protein